MERLRGRARLVPQLEVGVEGGEVQRHVIAQIVDDPLRQLFGFLDRIVQGGDDQVGELEPDVGLPLQPGQVLQHRLQVRQRDPAVEVLRERLQVHVRRIDVVVDVEEGLPGDVAVGDHHQVQALGPGRLGDVHHVLAPDGGLVVGAGDRRAAVLLRHRHHLFGLQPLGVHLVGLRLGNVPVLAEEAAHVAARRPHGENLGAGQEVAERLLLDGVDLDGGRLRVPQVVERAPLVRPDEAEARLALADVAVPRAQVAVQPPVRVALPPAGFLRLRRNQGTV